MPQHQEITENVSNAEVATLGAHPTRSSAKLQSGANPATAEFERGGCPILFEVILTLWLV
jgi:hypothetical protein